MEKKFTVMVLILLLHDNNYGFYEIFLIRFLFTLNILLRLKIFINKEFK